MGTAVILIFKVIIAFIVVWFGVGLSQGLNHLRNGTYKSLVEDESVRKVFEENGFSEKFTDFVLSKKGYVLMITCLGLYGIWVDIAVTVKDRAKK